MVNGTTVARGLGGVAIKMISLNSTSLSATEGDTVALTGAVDDLDGNLVSVVADHGVITVNADGTFEWSLATSDDADFTVTLTATDSYGAIGTAQFQVHVSNAQPAVELLGLEVDPATRVASLRLEVTDPGPEDSHSITVDWGEGTTDTYTVGADRFLEVSHAYAMPGGVQITVALQQVATRIAGVGLRSGELVVVGTDGDDVIKWSKRGRRSFDLEATFAGTLVQGSFDASSISSAFAELGSGNDQWQGSALSAPQTVFGEAGNDWVVSGAADDLVIGGDGVDKIETGDGDDMAYGGLGRDIVRAGGGNDVLVGGRYEREEDLVSLRRLQTVWTGKGNYRSKVDRLRAGVGTDPDGAIVRLAVDTIFDSEADELLGSSGTDWFLSPDSEDRLDIDRKEVRN